ncbi:MAG: 2-C-methyl-D-erythritol 4-phosphate cytidylyltransferase [Bacteroidota bacterium]
MPRVGVVIPAGGRGTRLGSRLPKQFLPLHGIPILQRTLAIFEDIPQVKEIVVASPAGYVPRVERLARRLECTKVSRIVAGGEERQESVWNALRAFSSAPDIVLVHDAVRPLVSKRVINAVIASASKYGAAVVGVKISETIKMEGKRGFYECTLDRKKLWAVQTPQGFRYGLLVKAHRSARRSRYKGTDEASLLERIGIPVRIVEGDRMNLKITTRHDFRLAEMLLKKRKSDSGRH